MCLLSSRDMGSTQHNEFVLQQRSWKHATNYVCLAGEKCEARDILCLLSANTCEARNTICLFCSRDMKSTQHIMFI